MAIAAYCPIGVTSAGMLPTIVTADTLTRLIAALVTAVTAVVVAATTAKFAPAVIAGAAFVGIPLRSVGYTTLLASKLAATTGLFPIVPTVATFGASVGFAAIVSLLLRLPIPSALGARKSFVSFFGYVENVSHGFLPQ